MVQIIAEMSRAISDAYSNDSLEKDELRTPPPASGDTLVDMFRQAVNNPILRSKIVLSDPCEGRRQSDEGELLEREWILGQLDEVTDLLARYFIERFECRRGGCVAIYMVRSLSSQT